MSKTRTKPRWRHDMLILGNTVVGSVEDRFGGGWWAFGCLEDWQDVGCGLWETKADAKAAVERWVEEYRED